MDKQAYERCMSAVMHKEAGWLGNTWNKIKNFGKEVYTGAKLMADPKSAPDYSYMTPAEISNWNAHAANQPNGMFLGDLSGKPLSPVENEKMKQRVAERNRRTKEYEDYVNKLRNGDSNVVPPAWSQN